MIRIESFEIVEKEKNFRRWMDEMKAIEISPRARRNQTLTVEAT